jgi:hypothetical protein
LPTPSKPGPSKIRRAISISLLVVLVFAIFLMLRKPKPVAEPQAPSVVAANAQSFQQKLTDLAQPTGSDASSAPAQVAFTTDEVQAALTEANSPQVAAANAASQRASETPNSMAHPNDQASLPANAPPPIITFENDVVRGQFQAEVSGQTVWVTVAGHLGAQDGYATLDPTEFKIGDLTVPVSLVNGRLQKKLLEQRDKLKLPDYISDIAVQNSQLVIKRK